MPRVARVVIPGCPHHITQRGNNRQQVFFVDDDYSVYLRLLRERTELAGVRIDGFCLMPNHIHLIATPPAEHSLARALGRTHFRYSQYLNRMHGRSGHLWQNRFFSCPLDPRHLLAAMLYVESNPVRAGLCRRAWAYRWSSASLHCGGIGEGGLIDLSRWQQQPRRWRQMLGRADEEFAGLIRARTQSGRPLAGDSFLSKLESVVGRRLRPLPVGRPGKKAKK